MKILDTPFATIVSRLMAYVFYVGQLSLLQLDHCVVTFQHQLSVWLDKPLPMSLQVRSRH